MGMNDTSINAFNLKIRQTDWYQQWFVQKGLNPNQVQLDDRQRMELKQLIEAKSGFQFPGDMKVDPAGNLNEKGGWAGLPTGVKIAIIAGATVATAGAAGAFSGAASPSVVGLGGTSAAHGAGAAASVGMTAGGTAAATTGAAATGGTLATLGAIAPYANMGIGAVGKYLEGRENANNVRDDRAWQSDENQRSRDFTAGEGQKGRDFTGGENQKDRLGKQNELIAGFLEGASSSDTNEQLSRSRMALDSTQMDPYRRAKELNSANVRRSFGEGVDKSGYFTGNYDLSAVSPEGLKDSEGRFDSIVNDARNGPAGWEDKKKAERDAILKYLQQYAGGA